jgi:hypothetical protein
VHKPPTTHINPTPVAGDSTADWDMSDFQDPGGDKDALMASAMAESHQQQVTPPLTANIFLHLQSPHSHDDVPRCSCSVASTHVTKAANLQHTVERIVVKHKGSVGRRVDAEGD